MSRKPISMRKIKEILRLKLECGLSERKTALSSNVPRSTVQDYLSRAQAVGLSLEEIKVLSDDELEKRLFPAKSQNPETQPLPDFRVVQKELRKTGVTLALIWEEYLVQHLNGYSYSQFCFHYRQFLQTIDVSMRQIHKAGEKLFVDYSGKTMEVIDQNTGEIRKAQIFVGVLGASNYTYAEATWTQSIEDWVGSHVRMFRFFGGVPALVVPDNLKSGVTRSWFYDPDINLTYAEMARHYNIAVLPAKANKPKYKAKVEGGVLIVQRWILASLRNRQFFSIAELNQAIRVLLEKLNNRPFKKLEGSRKSLFDSIEKAALRPLPEHEYEFAIWKKASVNIDYHVEFDHCYYSVPFQLVRQKVELRVTSDFIEVYSHGNRVAAHYRSFQKGKYSTIESHMPPQHKFCKWNSQRFIDWASRVGPNVLKVVEIQLSSRAHPEQAFRSCLGILKQEDKAGKERLDAACKRALHFGSPRCRTIVNILLNNQDRLPIPEKAEEKKLPEHHNVRGAKYYQDIN